MGGGGIFILKGVVMVVVMGVGVPADVGLDEAGETVLRRGVGIDELPIDSEDDILGKGWAEGVDCLGRLVYH